MAELGLNIHLKIPTPMLLLLYMSKYSGTYVISYLFYFWRKNIFKNFQLQYESGTRARIIILNPKSNQVTSLLGPFLPLDSPTSAAQGTRSLLQLPVTQTQQVSMLLHTKHFHFFNLQAFLASRFFHIFSLSGGDIERFPWLDSSSFLYI